MQARGEALSLYRRRLTPRPEATIALRHLSRDSSNESFAESSNRRSLAGTYVGQRLYFQPTSGCLECRDWRPLRFLQSHLVNPDVHSLNGLSVAVTLDGTPAAPHLSLPNEKTLRENRGKDTSEASR